MTMHVAPTGFAHRFESVPPSYTRRAAVSQLTGSATADWPPRGRSRRSTDTSVRSTLYNPPFTLLKQVLNEINHGLLLVTDSAQVRYANRVAARALLSTPALKMDGDTLLLSNPRDQGALLKALLACSHGRRSMLRVNAGQAEPLSLAVVPMSIPADDNGDEVVALLTLGKRQGYDALGLQFFVQSHHLTYAESKVLQKLCEGLRTTEIARDSGVALSTVRSQIRSICQKTQAKGIREIVGMVTRLPSMVSTLDSPPGPVGLITS